MEIFIFVLHCAKICKNFCIYQFCYAESWHNECMVYFISKSNFLELQIESVNFYPPYVWPLAPYIPTPFLLLPTPFQHILFHFYRYDKKLNFIDHHPNHDLTPPPPDPNSPPPNNTHTYTHARMHERLNQLVGGLLHWWGGLVQGVGVAHVVVEREGLIRWGRG